MTPSLEPLFTIDIQVHAPISTGRGPLDEVRVIPFDAGTFSGLGLQGRLLDGGTDWQTVRADGVIEIRAHYLLETEEHERIEVISEGVRDATTDVLQRITSGEVVPADEYYFRTFIRLRTMAPRLEHLNRRLCVAAGERRRDSVRIHVSMLR